MNTAQSHRAPDTAVVQRSRVHRLVAGVAEHDAVRFLLIGGLSAGVDAGLLLLLRGWLGVPLPVATFVAVATAFVVNFTLNRSWSFRSRQPAGRQFIRYLVLAAGNWVFTVCAVTGLAGLGVHYMVAKLVTLVVAAVLNYVGYRTWVFADGDRVRRRPTWLLAFLGFFLLMGAWAVALPPNAGPDEKAHVIRAAGVTAGQIRPGISGDGPFDAYHRVAAGWDLSTCFIPDKTVTADCQPAFDERQAWLPTPAGRYFPLYYMLVGAPLHLRPGPTGLIGARLLSVALAAALIASAFTVLARRSATGLLQGGLVVAVTPTVAHLAATVNPNGLEIAAGIALFASLIRLALDPGEENPAPLLLLFGVSAVIMATAKTNGPLWLVIIVLPFLPAWWRSSLRPLLRGWQGRACLLGVAGAVVAGGIWIVAVDASVVVPGGGGDLAPSQVVAWMAQNWPGFANDVIGMVGWGETRVPTIVYPLWTLAVGALLLPAVAAGTWRDRARLASVLALGVGVPFVAQLLQAPRYGFITQARYLLPLLVGIPLLAAFVADRRCANPRSLARLLVVLVVPLHVLTLAYVMVRYQHGLVELPGWRDLNPFTGRWLPPTGPAVPLLMVSCAAGLIAFLVWRPNSPDALPDADRGEALGAQAVGPGVVRGSESGADRPADQKVG